MKFKNETLEYFTKLPVETMSERVALESIGVGKLTGVLKDWGYEESLFDEQIDNVSNLGRVALLVKAGSKINSGSERKNSINAYIPPSPQ